MLVRVQPGHEGGAHGLSGAEEQLVSRLESWGPGQFHLPGLALVNVNVPDKTGVRQVDALLFTPEGLVVVEVKGFTRPQPGTLTVPVNGPWLVDGQPAAVHTLAGSNPGEQVKGGVYAAKAAFAGMAGGGGTFVTGLVALMPLTRELTIGDTTQAGTGIRVVVGSNRKLRRFMHHHRKRRACWTADGVLAACRALSLAELAPGRDELVAEGFPETVPDPAPVSAARQPEPRAEPGPPTAAPGLSPAASDPSSSTSRGPATPAGPPGPAPEPVAGPGRNRPPVAGPSRPMPPPPERWPVPPSRRRRVPWGFLLAVVLILAVSIPAIILVGQLFQGR